MSNCKSCRAPIVWAVFESGKRVPIDPGGREDGNIIVIDAAASPSIVRVEEPLSLLDQLDHGVELVPRKRYVSHFVTCPNADHHRRRS